jgi:putative mycofactocin binding protein MftB
VHPSVAVRPEPFGALVYHYGNRKLVFLKSPRIVALVRSLGDHDTVDAALVAAKVPDAAHAKYLDALASLLASNMIVPIAEASTESPTGEATDAATR